MKTNQIFNFKRFGRYALSTLTLRYRQLLLMIAAAVSGIFIFAFVPLLNHSTWHIDNWIGLAVTSTLIGGLLYVGSAFPSFRGREKTLGYLMIPASTFEKFLYEFIERIVAFLLLFPAILYSFSNLAIALAVKIKQHQYVGGVRFDSFSLRDLIAMNNSGNNGALFFGLLAILILAFAGTLIFRKYPQIKMIVFVMAIISAIGGYFYLIFEKMRLVHPWIEILKDYLQKEQAITILTIALLAFSLITFCYSYFKLKEKEVS
jgi:hypothetical protein